MLRCKVPKCRRNPCEQDIGLHVLSRRCDGSFRCPSSCSRYSWTDSTLISHVTSTNSHVDGHTNRARTLRKLCASQLPTRDRTDRESRRHLARALPLPSHCSPSDARLLSSMLHNTAQLPCRASGRRHGAPARQASSGGNAAIARPSRLDPFGNVRCSSLC
ncbi:hypothetical protein BV20DRAFT_972044 [Pilatotrama ljubarskyi]|nr:hypothetical protein BV20DRAFT_972044 [Pilatotrama ljubarskyi]